MTTGHDPTLLASMAASRETRVAVGVLVLALAGMATIGAFAAGAVHATETRFVSIEERFARTEQAIVVAQKAEDVRRARDEAMSRALFEQVVELRTQQEAQGVMLLELRDTTHAIRDAVAPLPRRSE